MLQELSARRGLTAAPLLEAEEMWLLEVACDSGRSGSKATRAQDAFFWVEAGFISTHRLRRHPVEYRVSRVRSKSIIERLTDGKVRLVVTILGNCSESRSGQVKHC